MQILIKRVTGTSNLSKNNLKPIPQLGFSKAPRNLQTEFSFIWETLASLPRSKCILAFKRSLGDGLHADITLEQLLLNEVPGGLARGWKTRSQAPFTVKIS